jgi:hypothetical protein
MSRRGKMKEKVVVYSCISGKYDKLQQPKSVNKDFSYICFTDQKMKNSGIWKIRPLQWKTQCPVRTARYHKLHPHNFFKEYDYSIWIDGNVTIAGNHFTERIKELINNKIKISSAIHPYRNCIYDEIQICIDFKKDDPQIMRRQRVFLQKQKYPKNNGLFESNIVFRKHNDEKIAKIMNDWWEQIVKFSYRDQLSFDYILWKNKITCEPFFKNKGKNVRNHKDYMLQTHLEKINTETIKNKIKKFLAKTPRIYKIVRAVYFYIVFTCVKHITSNIAFCFKKLNTVPKKIPQNSKIAVHLHLYYWDLADEFINCLKNIPYKFDLYITTPQARLDKEKFAKFKKEFENVKLSLPQNRGRDIGGFIYFLNDINLNDYDLILKIHSKKIKFDTELEENIKNISPPPVYPVVNRNLWRKCLLEGVLGSEKKVQDILTAFITRPGIGMISSKKLLLDWHTNPQEMEYFDQIRKKLKLIKYIRFFAGTMFWIRADILKPLKENYTIDDFDFSYETKDGIALEHGFERVFGTLVKSQGYNIKGI